MSRYSFRFTAAHELQLREFWPTTKPLRVLAAEWGCSAAYVSVKAKELGLPSRAGRMLEIRSLQHPSSPEDNAYLRHEASLRFITVSDLQQKIMRIVIRDKLVAAILDDAAAAEKKAA